MGDSEVFYVSLESHTEVLEITEKYKKIVFFIVAKKVLTN